jgi:hypothetical protein
MSLVTTAPAATTAPRPTVTPGSTVTPAATQQPFSSTMGAVRSEPPGRRPSPATWVLVISVE